MSRINRSECQLSHFVDPSKLPMPGWRLHHTPQSQGPDKTDRMIRILYLLLPTRGVHLQTSSRQDTALSVPNRSTRIYFKCLEEINSSNPFDRKMTRILRRQGMIGLVKLTKHMLNHFLYINQSSPKLLLHSRLIISPCIPSRRLSSINNNLGGTSRTLMGQQSPLRRFISSNRTKTWLLALMFNFRRDLKI